MKRLLLIGIIASVLLSPLAYAAPLSPQYSPSIVTHARTPVAADGNVSIYEDALDQSQTANTTGFIPVGNSSFMGWLNISVAQSFIPTKGILTRVQFYMAKNATATQPCCLAVRDNLTGADLAYATLSPPAFSTYPNFSWVEFDFFDIPVTVNTTYYIVIYTQGLADNYYFASGGGHDPYPNGAAYFRYTGVNWSVIPPGDGDAAFKTYGRDAPSWATGMYSGYWGLAPLGVPLPPAGWLTGFSRQKILFGFDGIWAPFNTTVHNATMALTGVILGPFLLGGIHNLTTDKGAWCIGLGGINATTSVFYYRIMFFIGPSFYLAGIYYEL